MADALSQLCLACGLCCDGSLFTHLVPRGDEARTLAHTKLRLIDKRDGSTVIGLPCPALDGACCTMYEARPTGCRAFICATGRQLVAGEIDEGTALARIAEARRRLEQVRGALPPSAQGDDDSLLRKARRHGLVDGPAPLREADAWLDAHFR